MLRGCWMGQHPSSHSENFQIPVVTDSSQNLSRGESVVGLFRYCLLPSHQHTNCHKCDPCLYLPHSLLGWGRAQLSHLPAEAIIQSSLGTAPDTASCPASWVVVPGHGALIGSQQWAVLSV